MKKSLILVFLACVFVSAGSAESENGQGRKKFARQLQHDVSLFAVHNVYVPDFVDVSGKQCSAGQFYAASFSKLLTDDAKGFTVIPRVDAHRSLLRSRWTDRDLAKKDALAKLVSEFAPDAILWGTLSAKDGQLTIEIIARDPTAKEIFRESFTEETDQFVLDMLQNDGAGPTYYFVTLDGVTFPKCVSCPDPSYTDKARSKRLQGQVILTVLVTAEGKAEKIRILRKLDPGLDDSSIRTVKGWEFEPAKDADGKSVAVRLPVEVTFRLR